MNDFKQLVVILGLVIGVLIIYAKYRIELWSDRTMNGLISEKEYLDSLKKVQNGDTENEKFGKDIADLFERKNK